MFKEILEGETFNKVNDTFQLFLQQLRIQNGSLCEFWMSYVSMVQLLLDIIRASREGD